MNDPEIANLLKETKELEQSILSTLNTYIDSKNIDFKEHEEEHRFLRELIEEHKESTLLKKTIRNNIIQKSSWLAFLASLTGLLYMFIEEIKKTL